MEAYNHYTDVAEDDAYSGFLGIHLSKASADRAAKRKADRRAFALDKIKARQAPKLEAAMHGIAPQSGFAQALGTVGNLALSLTGHGNSVDNGSMALQAENQKLQAQIDALSNKQDNSNNNDQQKTFNNGAPLPDASAKAKNTIFIVAGAIIFIVLVVALIMPKRK